MKTALKTLLTSMAFAMISCIATPSGIRTAGIDVSAHQGDIDWARVASDSAKIQFVYVKATEGATYQDKKYVRNVKGASAVGLKVGAYHYFRMTSGAHEQFRNFSGVLDSVPFDLIPMVDVETRDKASVEQLQDSLTVFLDLLEKRYGVAPMIYATNRSYNQLCAQVCEGKYQLYIGRYGSEEPVVTGESRYSIWQYSETGKVSGITKGVDLCAFRPGVTIKDISMPEKRREYVSVQKRDGLVIYSPSFSRVDLVTGKMPAKSDEDVILVCEAAFTGERLDEFRHSNIAGHHVCSGKFHDGYKCGTNNGVFTWTPKGGWKFMNLSHKNSVAPLKEAAANGGMGFCQNLIVFNGREFNGCFKAESVNQYRALCELDGRLCVVDCEEKMSYAEFKKGLMKLGVKNAIYCDMGWGWNYSWYRRPNGSVKEIFPVPGKYTTNWVTFYRQQ